MPVLARLFAPDEAVIATILIVIIPGLIIQSISKIYMNWVIGKT